jgi:hypothetical protein
MPRFLPAIKKGSAIFALPLLLLVAPAPAAGYGGNNFYNQGQQSSTSGGLEGSWTLLSINRDQLNEASSEAGFPGTSASTMQLWGAGSVLEKGATRYGVMGMTGGLASDDGSNYSNWGLDLAGITAEQRYGGSSSVEILAGFFAGLGQFQVEYRNAAGYTRFDSRFVGSGATAGLHWPANSSVSFLIRTGYLWLPAAGDWQGPLAGSIAKTYFDLSAPFGQAALDINF